MEPRRPSLWTQLVGDLDAAQSFCVMGAAAVVTHAVWRDTRSRGLGRAVAMAVTAWDLVGGLVAFQMPPTRAKYARAGSRERMIFVLLHGQPFVVPLSGEGRFSTAAGRYLAVLGGAAVADRLISQKQRLIWSLGLAGLLVTVDLVATRDEQQRWLGPTYFMKLLGGHASIQAPAVQNPLPARR